MKRRDAEKDDAAREKIKPDTKEHDALKLGYRLGIRAAAGFAEQFGSYIPMPKRFEDIILSKFNLIEKREMRKKRR
jgi:hypothetical protein